MKQKTTEREFLNSQCIDKIKNGFYMAQSMSGEDDALTDLEELLSKFKQHLIDSGKHVTRKSLVDWINSNNLPTSEEEMSFFNAFKLYMEPSSQPETSAVGDKEMEAENKILREALVNIRDRSMKSPVIYNIITKALKK